MKNLNILKLQVDPRAIIVGTPFVNMPGKEIATGREMVTFIHTNPDPLTRILFRSALAQLGVEYNYDEVKNKDCDCVDDHYHVFITHEELREWEEMYK